MCGIAGLFAKSPLEEERLGRDVAAMLARLAARGPDSAGVALYRDPVGPGQAKLSILDPSGGPLDGEALAGELGAEVLASRGDQAVLLVPEDPYGAEAMLGALRPGLVVLSAGRAIETAKRSGPPEALVRSTGLAQASGTHALAHTRMATESRVSTEHSHPFSTGEDLCLVHNGSLSNHNRLRRELRRRGIRFLTDNDSEVAAGFLAWRLREGDTLEGALDAALAALDGFFTFAVATEDGFAVLRDPIACKPAILAETDEWVAIASEHRALAVLPGAAEAEVWEPEPGRVYVWSHATVRA